MADALKPFWNYYGGKYRAAPLYPPPQHATIVEPFAGAAGYSLRYPDARVVLVEKYAVIAELWRYLISVRASEVRRIPLVDSIDDLPAGLPDGARALVGFALNNGAASPRLTLSSGLRKLRAMGRAFAGWSEARRERVASQVDRIRHWRIIEGDYTRARDRRATWFVDPPYDVAGTHYICSSSSIDFSALGRWCRSRSGQVIVCEQAGASWLPFQPMALSKAFAGKAASNEAIWTNAYAAPMAVEASA